MLNLHDPVAWRLEADEDLGFTDAENSIAAKLLSSHPKYDDADSGFVLMATSLETAVRNSEAEYGEVRWDRLTNGKDI
ncbi:hypothetical protein D3C85_1317600 [compost metagenome]